MSESVTSLARETVWVHLRCREVNHSMQLATVYRSDAAIVKWEISHKWGCVAGKSRVFPIREAYEPMLYWLEV
jgi:hypothetical protein